MMNLIKSYGNPDVVYSFPSSAVPPDVGKKETGRASVKAPSHTPSAASGSLTTTVRTPGSYVPTQHGLVSVVQVYRACRSCGSKAQLLVECRVLYYSDSNTDHLAEWEGSTLGMAWAAVGFTEWQQHLVLPRYEDCVQYYPRGTKLNMMGNDSKRAKNSHGGGNNPNASDGSDRSNQGQGGYNQNQGNQWGGGGDITPMQTKTRVVGPVVGGPDYTPWQKQVASPSVLVKPCTSP